MASTDSAKEASDAERIGKSSAVEGNPFDVEVETLLVRSAKLGFVTEVRIELTSISVVGAVEDVAKEVSADNEVVVDNVVGSNELVEVKFGKEETRREEFAAKEDRVVGSRFSKEFNFEDNRDSELILTSEDS